MKVIDREIGKLHFLVINVGSPPQWDLEVPTIDNDHWCPASNQSNPNPQKITHRKYFVYIIGEQRDWVLALC